MQSIGEKAGHHIGRDAARVVFGTLVGLQKLQLVN